MTNVLRILLGVVLFAWALAASTSLARGSPDGAKIADPDPARFENEIEAFEAWDSNNAYPREAMLFVGSSSVRMWPTAEAFPRLPVMNRGFGGSHISDVNYFAKRIVLKYRPNLVVFYAGDNDIEAGKSPQKVFEDFQAFVNLIHDQLPETTIIFLPIKPSIARWPKWAQMQKVNSRVKALSERDTRIVYVDTAMPMLGGDGKPRRELFIEDGLHLNQKGYRLWTEILTPVLTEIMKRRAAAGE